MNRKKITSIKRLLGGFLFLLLAPACIKTYKLAPSESSQGKEHKDNREVVKENVRTARVYDQWETRATFDVLWLSDRAREAYVDSHCLRRGKDEHARDTMLQRQLEENQHWISFYVLADVRDPFHPSLSDTNAAWTMYLDVGGQDKVLPSSIKEVELDPEIVELFGFRFSKPKFKTPYLVKFPAKDVGGSPYVDASKPFKMIISSVNRQCELGWQGGQPVFVKTLQKVCSKKGKLIKDEDYYWL